MSVKVSATIVALASAVFTTSAGAQPTKSGAPVQLTRDAAIGAPYGAPGPRSCSSMKLPAAGGITAAVARAYVICGYEGVHGSDTLLLLSKVQIQVGTPRPYVHVSDSLDGIDPRKPVYDIRGQSVRFGCSLPRQYLPHAQQCSRTAATKNEGKCYRTTFGDWRCTWNDFYSPISTDTRLNVAPPSAAEAE